jgi:hypothetical protein
MSVGGSQQTTGAVTMRRFSLFRRVLPKAIEDRLENHRWRSSAEAREAILEVWSDQLAALPEPPEPAVVLLSPDGELLRRALASSRGEIIVAGGDVVHIGRSGVEGLSSEALSAPSEPRRQVRTLKEVCEALRISDALVVSREQRGEEVADQLHARLGWVAVRAKDFGEAAVSTMFPRASVIVGAAIGAAGRLTIGSLIKSSWPNLEIIVVMAGSSAPEWLEELAASPSRPVRIVQDRESAGRLEEGASIASGETLLFVDVPLLASPGMVSALLGSLSGDGGSGIVGASLRRMRGKESRKLREAIESLDHPAPRRSGTIVRRAAGVVAMRASRCQEAHVLDRAFRSAASCEAAALQLAPRHEKV